MSSDTANLDVMRHAKHYNRAMAKLVIDRLDLRSRNGELRRSVLDFGAGQGTFLQLLQSETRGRPLQWYAVEPELATLTASKETQMLSSLLSLPAGSVDCVYSLNVFEHIKEDKLVFTQLLEKVKVGGVLFILVPAHMELWTEMDKRVGHFRRYTNHSLRFLVRAHNAALMCEGNFDAIGYWLARLVAAIERKRPVDPDKAGLVTEAQIKVFDYLFFLGNPLVKALNWLTGVKKAKNRWVLVKKLG